MQLTEARGNIRRLEQALSNAKAEVVQTEKEWLKRVESLKSYKDAFVVALFACLTLLTIIAVGLNKQLKRQGES